MNPIEAARNLLTEIPLRWRQRIYGACGLLIVVDGIWDVIPAGADSQVVATFGALGLVLALANASEPETPVGG